MSDYDVVAIVDYRRSGSKRKFLVKWADSWVEERNLVGCQQLVEEFMANKGNRSQSIDTDQETNGQTGGYSQETNGHRPDDVSPNKSDYKMKNKVLAKTNSDEEWQNDGSDDPEEDDNQEEWEPEIKKKKKTFKAKKEDKQKDKKEPKKKVSKKVNN